MSAPGSRFRKLWLAPLALGVLTGAGLISALLGDGALDALSWLALAIPLVGVTMILFRSRKAERR